LCFCSHRLTSKLVDLETLTDHRYIDFHSISGSADRLNVCLSEFTETSSFFCGFNRCGRPRITFSALRTIFSCGLCHCGYYRITFSSSRIIFFESASKQKVRPSGNLTLMSPQVVDVLEQYPPSPDPQRSHNQRLKVIPIS